MPASPGPASQSLASPSIPGNVSMEVAGSQEVGAGGSEDTSPGAQVEVAAAMVTSPYNSSSLSLEVEVTAMTGVREDSVEASSEMTEEVQEDRAEAGVREHSVMEAASEVTEEVQVAVAVEATSSSSETQHQVEEAVMLVDPGSAQQQQAASSQPAEAVEQDDGTQPQQRVGAGLLMDETMAMKFILFALEQEKKTAMFEEGVEALLQIRSRLAAHPQWCESVLLIRYIRVHLPPDLVDQLEAAAAPLPEDGTVDTLPGQQEQPSHHPASSATATTTTTPAPKFYNKHRNKGQGVVVHGNLHKTSTTPDGRPKRIVFKKEDLHISTILFYLSFRMYNYIRSIGLLHLPDPSTIRKHIKYYEFRPGFQEEQFFLLAQKMKSLKDPRDRCVSLIFDEVHLEV